MVGVAGCGEKKGTEESNASSGSIARDQIPDSSVTSNPGEALGQNSMNTPVAGVFMRPYFDEAGATELAVAVGEEFDIHLFADTVEPYSTNAAQFRMELPPGVTVNSLKETEERSISAGQYDTGYMIAYNCQPAGKFRIITFHCVAAAGFRGGEIKLAPGLGGDVPYFGFSTCDYMQAPANTGIATLKQK
jgi:hypothetical protein